MTIIFATKVATLITSPDELNSIPANHLGSRRTTFVQHFRSEIHIVDFLYGSVFELDAAVFSQKRVLEREISGK